jgi:molybdopterin converting factor small subunit
MFDLLPVVRVIEESIIRLDLDTAIDVLSELRERLEAEKESYELDLEEKPEFEHLEIPF